LSKVYKGSSVCEIGVRPKIIINVNQYEHYSYEVVIRKSATGLELLSARTNIQILDTIKKIKNLSSGKDAMETTIVAFQRVLPLRVVRKNSRRVTI